MYACPKVLQFVDNEKHDALDSSSRKLLAHHFSNGVQCSISSEVPPHLQGSRLTLCSGCISALNFFFEPTQKLGALTFSTAQHLLPAQFYRVTFCSSIAVHLLQLTGRGDAQSVLLSTSNVFSRCFSKCFRRKQCASNGLPRSLP